MLAFRAYGNTFQNIIARVHTWRWRFQKHFLDTPKNYCWGVKARQLPTSASDLILYGFANSVLWGFFVDNIEIIQGICFTLDPGPVAREIGMSSMGPLAPDRRSKNTEYVPGSVDQRPGLRHPAWGKMADVLLIPSSWSWSYNSPKTERFETQAKQSEGIFHFIEIIKSPSMDKINLEIRKPRFIAVLYCSEQN